MTAIAMLSTTMLSAQSFNEYKKLAKRGDAKAQYEVGCRYYYGTDVKQNYDKALMWWHKAAEQRNLDAQYSLGLYYII